MKNQDLLKVREILKAHQMAFWNDQCIIDEHPKLKFSFIHGDIEISKSQTAALLLKFKEEFGRRLRFAGFVFYSEDGTTLYPAYSIGLED
jgi:hypothetical protein